MANLRRLPARLTCGPFHRDQARALDIPDHVIDGPRFRRLRRCVYVLAGHDVTDLEWVDAALASLPPTAIASHDTAAMLLGLPLPRRLDHRPHFWVPDSCTGLDDTGVVLHRYKVRPDTTMVDGRCVTSPGKTFIDMATRLSLPDLVALGDAVVRRTGCLPLELQRLAREPRRRWIRKARQAARLVRAGVESAPETHLRLAILDEFLPEPEVGRDVFDEAGGWIARPDLSWPQWKVAVEYDGEHHLKQKTQYNRDIGRRENLEDAGWVVIVVTSERLYKRRPQTIARIQRHLIERGAPIF